LLRTGFFKQRYHGTVTQLDRIALSLLPPPPGLATTAHRSAKATRVVADIILHIAAELVADGRWPERITRNGRLDPNT
jgi:hypothetical protein